MKTGTQRMQTMHGRRALWGALSAAYLLSGCTPDRPPKAAVAEEPIVMAPAPADARPLPEIDSRKPLQHAADVHQRTCVTSRRRGTVCK